MKYVYIDIQLFNYYTLKQTSPSFSAAELAQAIASIFRLVDDIFKKFSTDFVFSFTGVFSLLLIALERRI